MKSHFKKIENKNNSAYADKVSARTIFKKELLKEINRL